MAALNENIDNNLNNSIMILTIDIGNGVCDKLRIHNLHNYEQETYDFCASNNLDFKTMREINSQIQKVINENKIFINDMVPYNNKQNTKFQTKKNIEEKNIKKNNCCNINKRKNIPNKKIMNRYNVNPLSYINQRKKESNKNNSYGIQNNNTRVNTSSSKNSSLIYNKYNKQKNQIIKNVKNAFKSIKNNCIFNENKDKKEKDNNLMIRNDMFNDINNYLEYSINTNENINDKNENRKDNIIDIENMENFGDIGEKNIIFQDLIEEKKKFSFNPKKRKESIEVCKTEDINNTNNQIIKKENEEKDELELNIDNNNQVLTDNNRKNNDNKENSINEKIIENNNKESKTKIRAKSERINHKKNQELSIKNLKNSLIIKKNNSNRTFHKNYHNKNNHYPNSFSNEDIIKNYKKYKEEKYNYLKSKQEIELKKQCTFHPKINEMKSIFNKDIILNKKSKSLGRFEKLYNDRIYFIENKNKLKEEIEKKFNYKPIINKNSLYTMSNISFNERLKLYTNRTMEKKNKIKEDIENKNKINEYYQPKLNVKKNKELLKERNYINSKSNSNRYEKYNVQYLYGIKYEQKKQFLTEKYYEEKLKKAECCEMTNELFNIKKEKSFKKLFKLLDGDNDGKISYNCISIRQLPINLKNLLEPILYELKIENEELNENEFIFVCEKYYNTLKYDQKRNLILFDDEEKKKLKKEKIEKENINYSFKPKINKYINLTYERNKNKIKLNRNRISSFEREYKVNQDKNRIKSIDIKKFNFTFRNNNKLIEKKNEDNNLNVVNKITICKIKEQSHEEIKDTNNIENNNINNNLVIQNLENKIDREINYLQDNIN